MVWSTQKVDLCKSLNFLEHNELQRAAYVIDIRKLQWSVLHRYNMIMITFPDTESYKDTSNFMLVKLHY